MKYLLVLLVSLLCVFPIFGQQILTETSVYFDTDKHHLTAASKASLAEFSSILKESNRPYEIVIEAHTDNRASQAYNTALSERRAKSVENYLKNDNINIENIAVNVFGEDKPAFSNNDENSMRKNRRVDVKAMAIGNEISELDKFLAEESQKRTQFFKINNNEKNLVIGKQGTKIYIEPNTFVFENGETPNSNEIQLTMKEAYNLEDMMMFQLSTHSDDKILETGGMVFLQATSQGQLLKIKDDKSITIGLPTDRLKDDMQLFDGVSNGNKIEWEATNQGFAEVPFELTPPQIPDFPISSVSYFVKRYPNRKPMLNDAQHEYYKKRIPELVLYIDLVKPQRPTKPFEPQLEQIVYDGNRLKSLFIRKRKIEKNVQDTYNRKLTVYNRKLKQYEIDLEKYQIDSISFPAWVAYQKQRMDIATGKLMNEFDTIFKATGHLSNGAVQHYFFTQNKLGWINCDRFYDTPEEQKMTLTINDNDDEKELIYVIFRNINSCINVNRQDATSFTTQLIPKSSKITIIGLKVQNGKNYIAKHQTIANAQSSYNLNYELVNSSKELTELLKF